MGQKGLTPLQNTYAANVFSSLLEKEKAAGGNQKTLGEKLDVDQSRVSQIAKHGNTSAATLIVAALLDGRPFPEVLRVLGLRVSVPGVTALEDAVYPSRGLALAMLRGLAPDPAIEFVRAIKHKGAESYSEFDWVRQVVRIADQLDGGLTAEKVFPGTVVPDETKPKKAGKGGKS